MNKKFIFLFFLIIVLTVGIFFSIKVINNKKFQKSELQQEKYDTIIIDSNVKTEYNLNDKFLIPSVYILHANGGIDEVENPNDLIISGNDLSNSGNKIVTIIYKYNGNELTTSYSIIVYDSQIIGLDFECHQNELVWGENIDKSKIRVIAYYSDGRNEEVNDYSIKYNNRPDNYVPIEVTVGYKGLSRKVTINIVPRPIDQEYKTLEDEAVYILERLGIYNPTSPKNYELKFDIYGVPSISFEGDFDKDLQTEEQIITYLEFVVFSGYLFDGQVLESREIVLPSKKIVFKDEGKGIVIDAHFLKIFGKYSYTIIIKSDI